MEFHPESYQIKPPHDEQLTDLLRELEFTSLLKSLQPSQKQPETTLHDTVILEDEAGAQRFVGSLPKDAPLGVHCLPSGRPGVHSEVLGLALSTGNQTAFIPIDVHAYMRAIIEVLHDHTHTKTVHDLKATLLAFHRIGITLARPNVDTMIADYLLNPNRRDHSLDTIMLERLGERFESEHRKRHPRSRSLKSILGRARRQRKLPPPWLSSDRS